MRRSVLFVAFLVLGVATAFGLGGCATPYDKVVVVRGQAVVVHVDYTDNPCGVRGPDAGCSAIIDGTRHIWYSGAAPAHIIGHEEDHDMMDHAAWQQYPHFGWCAEITRGGSRYPVGGLICLEVGRPERIVTAHERG